MPEMKLVCAQRSRPTKLFRLENLYVISRTSQRLNVLNDGPRHSYYNLLVDEIDP